MLKVAWQLFKCNPTARENCLAYIKLKLLDLYKFRCLIG